MDATLARRWAWAYLEQNELDRQMLDELLSVQTKNTFRNNQPATRQAHLGNIRSDVDVDVDAN